MRAFSTTIAEIETFAGQFHVRCAPTAPPFQLGQFFLLETGAFLRQPVFPLSNFSFALPSTFSVEPNQPLHLLGPLGSKFQWPLGLTRLLLMGDEPARLWWFVAEAIQREVSVVWLWPSGVPEWAGALPPAVEFHAGTPTRELADWADVAVLDVPTAEEAARRLRSLNPLKSAHFVQAFCVPTVPCGTGACQACWVETRRGRKLACVDGPIFGM
jgi:hypothetical protein